LIAGRQLDSLLQFFSTNHTKGLVKGLAGIIADVFANLPAQPDKCLRRVASEPFTNF